MHPSSAISPAPAYERTQELSLFPVTEFRSLSDDPFHHTPFHVRQAEVAAAIPVCQFLMIEPEQMQNRGLQIVHVDRLVDNLETEFIRLPVSQACFDTTAGENNSEAVDVVVATVV